MNKNALHFQIIVTNESNPFSWNICSEISYTDILFLDSSTRNFDSVVIAQAANEMVKQARGFTRIEIAATWKDENYRMTKQVPGYSFVSNGSTAETYKRSRLSSSNTYNNYIDDQPITKLQKDLKERIKEVAEQCNIEFIEALREQAKQTA